MPKETTSDTPTPPPVGPAERTGIPPVNPHYTRQRIQAQDARKEAHRKGSSRPTVRPPR